MTNKEILQADMLDILFEHRNKMYGAYALRKSYPNRLVTALGAALVTVLLFLLTSVIKKQDGSKYNPNNENNKVQLIKVDILKEKPVDPEPRQPKQKPPAAIADHQPIVVVPDKLANEPLPEQIEIENAIVGNTNRPGEAPGDIVEITSTSSGGNNNTPGKEMEEQPEFIRKEIPPSFPGGEQAWIQFLRKFLQAPDDLDAGQRIVVIVRFWVDVDGSVSRPEIIQSGGRSFDNEVLWVMRKMPKWQPAEQNGQKVAIAYTQPVTFLGVEE